LTSLLYSRTSFKSVSFRIMIPSLTLILGLGLSTLSQASPLNTRQDSTAASVKLLIGGGPSASVLAADFDGSTITIVANHTVPGSSASWLLFRENTNILYAVDENSDTTRLFNFDAATNALTLVQNATGSSGVVFLDFTADGNNMVGAAYGQGTVDVWDLAPETGALSLKKQIVSNDPLGPNTERQDKPHPHQALLDTSGRFFVVPDLGTDTLLVIDSADDAFTVSNHIRVEPAGCGPRHGVFYPPVPAGGAAREATHYFHVCEMMSLVLVYEVSYTGAGLELNHVQSLSTFGKDFPPADPAGTTAGEIQVSVDGRDVYVSNRGTGNETDSISHFGVETTNGTLSLGFRDTLSTRGSSPRMFSLALGAERFVFVANQGGELGLVAFRRNADGSLVAEPAASLPLGVFGVEGFGPQFVQQI
jgi:6-phosphogluconolactonase (cycloisomerase 2 family)